MTYTHPHARTHIHAHQPVCTHPSHLLTGRKKPAWGLQTVTYHRPVSELPGGHVHLTPDQSLSGGVYDGFWGQGRCRAPGTSGQHKVRLAWPPTSLVVVSARPRLGGLCVWGSQMGIHLTRASRAKRMSKQTDRHASLVTRGGGRAGTKPTRTTQSTPSRGSHSPRPPLPSGTCQHFTSSLAPLPDSLAWTFPKIRAG